MLEKGELTREEINKILREYVQDCIFRTIANTNSD